MGLQRTLAGGDRLCVDQTTAEYAEWQAYAQQRALLEGHVRQWHADKAVRKS